MVDLRGARPRHRLRHYRRGRTQLFSAAFAPLFGRRAEGRSGKLIDSLALFATLFGSAASLGFGALQIRTGMQEAGWIETGTPSSCSSSWC